MSQHPYIPLGQPTPSHPNPNQLSENLQGLNMNAQPFTPNFAPPGPYYPPQPQNNYWSQQQYPYTGGGAPSQYAYPNPVYHGQDSHRYMNPYQPPSFSQAAGWQGYVQGSQPPQNDILPHKLQYPSASMNPSPPNEFEQLVKAEVPDSWEFADVTQQPSVSKPIPPAPAPPPDTMVPVSTQPGPLAAEHKPVPATASAHADTKQKKTRKERDDQEVRPKPHNKQTGAKYPKVKLSIKPEDSDTKETVNIVFIGHVDAGKSTIGGHLMYLTGMVDKRTLEKYEKEAKEINRDSWFYSWSLDTDQNERDRGKTVEVGRAGFETESKRFTILDAPGHAGFVPNMITGTAQADIAILVISARRGEFETGFEKKGQTREHAILVKTAGIKHIVVLVNKMDDITVAWEKERFDEIHDKLTPFLKKVGYSPKSDIMYIPVSGLGGANLMTNTGECPFYTGPGFIEYLDSLPPVARLFEGPFRLPVIDKMKDMGTVILGKIESGCVTPGQQLVMMPNKTMVEVVHILFENDEYMPKGECGDNVRMRLKGIEEEEILPGFVLCEPASLCMTTSLFDVQIVILDCKNIICAGYSAVMHVHSCVEEVQVVELFSIVDRKTGDRSKKKPLFVRTDDVVNCRLQSSFPLCIETFKDFPQMGRFTLRDEGKTVAIGKILRISQAEK